MQKKNFAYLMVFLIIMCGLLIISHPTNQINTTSKDSTNIVESLDSNILNHSRIPDSPEYYTIPYDDDTN